MHTLEHSLHFTTLHCTKVLYYIPHIPELWTHANQQSVCKPRQIIWAAQQWILRCGECDSNWATVKRMYVNLVHIVHQPTIFEDKVDNVASVASIYRQPSKVCIPTYPQHIYEDKVSLNASIRQLPNSCISTDMRTKLIKVWMKSTQWQEMESSPLTADEE